MNGIHGSGAEWETTILKNGELKVDVITQGQAVSCDVVAKVATGSAQVVSDERKPDGDCQPVEQMSTVNEG